MNCRYSFLGAGNMAYAIVNGLISGGAEGIVLYDKFEAAYDKFDKAKVIAAKSVCEAVELADIVILSVKPQNFEELLSCIRESNVELSRKLFVSIGAGITIDFICSHLGREVPCVRTMPNTPMLIGKGVTALTRNSAVSDDEFSKAIGLFSALGDTVILDESQMNAVISATSSSPAYVYLFIKAIADSAEAQGFSYDEMLKLVCKVVIGSAEMVLQSGKTPDELIRMVTSPNGTTERALKVLNENNFADIVNNAMLACTKRADELSGK